MDRAVYEIKAWRVDFEQTASSGGMPIREAATSSLASRSIDVDEALNAAAAMRGNGIDIIWLPPIAGSEQALEKRLEPDPSGAAPLRRPAIRASLRSTRVVWTENCALVSTAADQLSDAMDAVVRFTQAERRAADLERDMAETWPEIDALKALTHRVTRRQLGSGPKVGALTDRVTDMYAKLLGLQTAIEQLDPKLSAGSKRLYAELVLQASIHDRMEMLEDPIDFAREQCELVNTRIIDRRNALTGFYLEALILAVLTAELIVFLHAKL